MIATVEDPDAIRAILGVLAGSEELVGRAPPFVPAVLRHSVICRADVAFEVI